jgi:predicted transcriptional regulator
MENVNEKILADYRLIVSRLDIMKGEITELERSNWKLRKAFNELLDIYQEELDRRDSVTDREEVLTTGVKKQGF